MANYKEVFKLAEDKGYKPILVHIAKYGGDATLPHEVTDSAGQLCELTLIQKWLREEKGIITESQYDSIVNLYFVFTYFKKSLLPTMNNGFGSYEEALLQGINEALKLIN